MDYSQKLRQINNRYNPDSSVLVEQRMFSGESAYDKDVARYVMRAMKAVDDEYTKRTKAAGEVVKQHLRESLTNVSYEYQGSVMTDTHIRGASDIDLLVLCEKFVGTDIFKVRQELAKTWKYNDCQIGRLCQFDNSFSQYEGNSSQDMASLRTQIEKIMSRTYTICDTSKPKAVKITNQNLHRDVDIVTSSWFQSLDYVLDGMPENERGIKIYNKSTGLSEGPDYPFLSISRINQRSADTNGRLKRMIRFLKNVRTDSEKDLGGQSEEGVVAEIGVRIAVLVHEGRNDFHLPLADPLVHHSDFLVCQRCCIAIDEVAQTPCGYLLCCSVHIAVCL